MKIINLRDYYPFYTQDTLLENSDEVAQALADAERLERNYNTLYTKLKLFSFHRHSRWLFPQRKTSLLIGIRRLVFVSYSVFLYPNDITLKAVRCFL